MTPTPSARSDVAPFLAMDVLAKAAAAERAGRSIAHLEVGQPAEPLPAKAREAVEAALRSAEPLGYTEALGLRPLRERIARMYEEIHGLAVSAERIVVTTGSSAGFHLTFSCLFGQGERVALADPGYPSYRNILRSLDVTPVRIEGWLADGYQPTVADLAAAREDGPLAGLLVASPANPTGTMLSPERLRALVEDCAAAGTALVSDEIYDRLWYDERPLSALALTDDAVVINSFSKFHGLTGWRVGWMVVPEALSRRVERLAQNAFICAPHVAQVTALAAMDCEDVLAARVEGYRRNRALLIDALPPLGFRDFAPADGAFYLYADVSALTGDSMAFAQRMLDEAGVAAVPGLDFDPVRGGSTMRFSFAGSYTTMEMAAERLTRWLG